LQYHLNDLATLQVVALRKIHDEDGLAAFDSAAGQSFFALAAIIADVHSAEHLNEMLIVADRLHCPDSFEYSVDDRLLRVVSGCA
jgi:hypothetical protein